MTTGRDEQRSGRGTLSRDVIMDAAVEVIEAGGLEHLTMRRLGAALGVDAMAVYGYFDNKAALLDAVVAREAARLSELPGPFPTDPLDGLLHVARHYRRILLEHPNLAPLVATRPLPQHRVPEIVLFGVQVLVAAGFAEDDIPTAADALVTFVLGFVLLEAGRAKQREELGEDHARQQEVLLEHLATLPDDTSLAEAVVARRLRPDATAEEFETGIRALVRGLRAGLGRPQPPTT